MKISLYLAAGFAVVTLTIGMAIGYYLTTDYQLSMYDKYTMDLGPADRSFDLRYINSMIAHHRGAMLLAEQLKEKTTRPEMKNLAEAILKDEPPAIDELYDWKKNWYGETKQVRDPIVANLGPADENFDLRFLNAIIAHHEEGVIMTKETRTKSSRAEILNNADKVEDFLSNGIEALTELRTSWYNL